MPTPRESNRDEVNDEEPVPALVLAEDLAEAGWRILPLFGKKPARMGRRPLRHADASSDVSILRRWAKRWPKANAGLLLDGSGAVVIDLDGPESEATWLRWIAEANLAVEDVGSAPVVRTGKGRHLYFRQNPEAVQVPNSTSGGDTIDIKTRGYMVAPGSVHPDRKEPYRYQGDSSFPGPDHLPRFPPALAEVIRRERGPRTQAPGASRRVARRTATGGSGAFHGSGDNDVHRSSPPPVMDVKTSLTVRSMLENTSDGRDSRAYTVVCHLIRDGFTDEHIVDLVIGSPLGAKAERARPWDPQGWVQHKIDEARRSGVSPGESRLFDQEAAWFIARRAGLAPGTLRVLDYLMDSTTHPRGFVRRGQDQIALESAVGSGKGPVDNLIQTGWLVRLAEPEWVESEQMWTASLYRLCHPADLRDASSLRPVRPRHDPLRGLRGHDAFRSRAGSLSSAYGMLTVLYGLEGPVPSISDLVDLMGKGEKTVSRTVTLLARDGLIRDGVVVRAQAEVRSLLDRSSIRSGTAGARKRHLALIRQKRADYQEFLADRPRRVLERELQQIRERAPQWAVNAGLPRGEHAAFVERLLHDARSGIGTRPDDVNLDLDLTDFV